MENRNHARISVNAKVMVQKANGTDVGQYLNVSATGALIQNDIDLVPGEKITLLFQVLGNKFCSYPARVVRKESGQFAVAFRTPLRAEHLTHLLSTAA